MMESSDAGRRGGGIYGILGDYFDEVLIERV